MTIAVGSLSHADQSFLWEMLYQAMYVPEGQPPFPTALIRQPRIAQYAEKFGKDGDLGLFATDEKSGEKVGAVWLRLFGEDNKGYGFVSAEIPELAMAVLPAWRGKGIGSHLLTQLLAMARQRYPAASLSTYIDNPAVRLYERFGFATVARTHDSQTMLLRFASTTGRPHA